MPHLKFKHVVSCSSEDKSYPAENLLKDEGVYKWRAAAAGEKQVSVILQLEKASQIKSLDVGNDGSAFVEVLIGKSSSAADDFKVLLVASSFMNPLESRNGQNATRVRFFDSDKLSRSVAEEKWDRIKVVCTQPFNKTSSYGLSFIRLNGPGADGSSAKAAGSSAPAPAPSRLGTFSLKVEAKDDAIKPGALFANRNKPSEPPLAGAAAVRAVSRLVDVTDTSKPKPLARKTEKEEKKDTDSKAGGGVPKRSKKRSATPEPSNGASKNKAEDEPLKVRRTDSKKGGAGKTTPADKPSLRKQSTSDSSSLSVASGATKHALKRTKTEPASGVPLHRVMEKVVFAISGIQNPERARIRDVADEMGAQYRANWSSQCSHLVCAFVNTPKYNQASGKSRIVTKEWLFECHKAKRLLPWRKYRLGDADYSSSEDEEAPPSPKKGPKPGSEKAPAKASPVKGGAGAAKADDAADPYGGSTDDGGDTDVDTEDELRRARAATAAKDVYDASTDEEGPKPADTPAAAAPDSGKPALTVADLPPLPNFFRDRTFLLYGEFTQDERRTLRRYIVAFDGVIEEYMGDKIQYVVTRSDWDNNFEEALVDNPDLNFVRPNWIYACNDKNSFVPHQKYIVIPS